MWSLDREKLRRATGSGNISPSTGLVVQQLSRRWTWSWELGLSLSLQGWERTGDALAGDTARPFLWKIISSTFYCLYSV